MKNSGKCQECRGNLVPAMRGAMLRCERCQRGHFAMDGKLAFYERPSEHVKATEFGYGWPEPLYFLGVEMDSPPIPLT